MHSSEFTIFSASAAENNSYHKLSISRAESLNHDKNDSPDKACDGKFNTWYTVDDDQHAGNFLKLFLSKSYSIGEVRVISRNGNSFIQKMLNTEIKVYSTEGGEIEVVNCGTITGKFIVFNYPVTPVLL